MLSALMFILCGLSVGFGVWSGIVQVDLYYMPIYYILAVITFGLGVSLRRYRL